MLTVVVALAVLLAVGLTLGRAPLFRVLVSLLTLAVFTLITAPWLSWMAVVEVDRWLRPLGEPLEEAAVVILCLLPPLLATGLTLRWLRRRGRPRFLWRLAESPATLSLPGILLVQASLLLIWLVGGNLAAMWRERQVEQAWSGMGQSLQALPGRYPKGPTNTAGVEIARLAGALGIAVGGDSAKTGIRGQTSHGQIRVAMSDYVFRETKRSVGPTAAPPLEVRAWLAMSGPRLDALDQELRSGGPIVWETDIDAWQTFPLGGLRDVHSALVASALEAMRQGQTVLAATRLEGAWRLTASLREGSSTAARLLATMQDRHRLGALRAGAPANDDVRADLEALTDPGRPLEALAVEARSFLEDARAPRNTLRGLFLETNWAPSLDQRTSHRLPSALFVVLSGGGVPMETAYKAIDAERARAEGRFYRLVQGPLERPYLRLCAADYARAVQAEYAKVMAVGDRCVPVPERIDGQGPDPRLASWSLVGDGSVSIDRLAHTVAVLGAEVELTRHVLRARALRAADPKHGWPGQLPGLDSAVCRGRHWTYSVLPDGTASVRLDESPFAEREATVEYRMSEP
jgi:hypothetical protein